MRVACLGQCTQAAALPTLVDTRCWDNARTLVRPVSLREGMTSAKGSAPGLVWWGPRGG